MDWTDLIETLINENHVGAQGNSVSKELRCIIGDLPIFRFHVDFIDGIDEKHTVYCDTVESLKECITVNNVFMRCSACGGFITGGMFVNDETGEVFCNQMEMVESMNERFGIFGWRPKEGEGIFKGEDDEHTTVNEYQYEIRKLKPGYDECDFIDGIDDAEEWVPYHLYYVPFQ